MPADAPYEFATLVPHTSLLTGRTVLANVDPVRFGIRPDLTEELLRLRLPPQWAIFEPLLESHMAINRASRRGSVAKSYARIGAPLVVRNALISAFQATEPVEFAGRVSVLISLREKLAKDGDAAVRVCYESDHPTLLDTIGPSALNRQILKRLTDALVALWRGGLITFPAEFFTADVMGRGVWGRNDEDKESGNPYVPVDQAAFRLETSSAPHAPQMFTMAHRKLLLCVLDITSSGDLDEDLYVRLCEANDPAGAEARPTYAKRLRTLLGDLYHEAHLHDVAIPEAKRDELRPPDGYTVATHRRSQQSRARIVPSRDPLFRWADALPDHTEPWRQLCRQHLQAERESLTHEDQIVIGRRVLRLVAEKPYPPPHELLLPSGFDVAAALQKEVLARSGKTTRARYAQLLRDLFDTAVLNAPRLPDGSEDGRFRNPLATRALEVVDKRGAARLSTKIPLPQRFIRLAKEIIVEPGDDGESFGWPRTLKGDYFTPPGHHESVWSPARSHLLLFRLHVPVRSFQARMLDSGFGDYMIFDTGRQQWVRNRGPHAPLRENDRVPQGLLKQMLDTQSGRTFTGLHITTNKTADREAGFENPGYDIPYGDPEVIALFCRARDFQLQYGESFGPITRADLADQVVNPKLKSKLIPTFPLFRDLAAVNRPDLPPTQGRMDEFWTSLLEEMERRLLNEGIRNDDGSAVRLLTERNSAGVRKPIYTGHSLRLSGVQRLLMAGLPLEIVSAIVGHSSIVMTLVYYKPSAEYITGKLADAEARLLDAERQEFEALLRDPDSRRAAQRMIVSASDYAADMLVESQSAAWGSLDAFLCPNGATMCDDGGPLLRVSGGRARHGPVLGGARNCALCRFACTTPAHLPALVAHWNSLRGRIRLVEEEIVQREARRREAGAAARAQRADGLATDSRRLSELDGQIDRLQEDVATLSETLVATTKLIARVVDRLKEWDEARMADGSEAAGGKFPLVANGPDEITVRFDKVADIDLWDRICRDAVVYSGIDAQIPAAKRARLLDTLLHRNGHAPLTLGLSEDQLLAYGNAAIEFLRFRIGDESWAGTVAGSVPLEASVVDGLRDLLPAGEESARSLASGGRMPITATSAKSLPGAGVLPVPQERLVTQNEKH